MLGKRREISLQVSIAAIFVLLILPALGLVIAFSYHQNARNLRSLSDRFIDRARDEAITATTNFLAPVGATLRLVAEMAGTRPGFFRSEDSRNVLYKALTSADQIDALYVSFEDGYHRVVTRIDADRRRSDPRIPPRANWHSSWVDPFDAAHRQRHRTFFETWPDPIGGYDVDSDFDPRTLTHYRMAKATNTLGIADPAINPDTGYPIISLGYPIKVDGKFVGAASANITLTMMSHFLDAHRASRNSITVIADRLGDVIAHPIEAHGVRREGGKTEVMKLTELDEPQVVEAAHQRLGRDRFTFDSQGEEYIAEFAGFPADFGKDWEVLVVTPTDDFVGGLKETNRKLLWMMAAVALVESALIYFMARRLSRPIEIVSEAIQGIRRLAFPERLPTGSPVREIAQLERATALLDNALRSFSVFVPVGLVRRLIDSGKPLQPGVEQRFMTVLFSDVEGFTTLAEQLAPHELTEQTSRYFENVTGAVAEEQGTIDKFIGDSVMAFWGAPAALEDHAFHACRAALKARHRMARLGAEWAASGRKPMRVRIGVHCGDVVVGNVGSPERLSYTVMGDGVNIASRLEGINKQFGSTICISEAILAQVGDRVVSRPLELLSVRGRSGRFVIHELLGIAGGDDPELAPSAADIRLCALTAAAWSALAQGDTAEAQRCYEAVQAEFPHDQVARHMLAHVARMAHEPAAGG
ncbi:MAG TPA: adenylate/guanylate cyclase domain-containing protein [Reyranella sp.]